jgi:DNA modification methylase
MAKTLRHGYGWTGVTGNKDPDAMRCLIRDYSDPGDLVVDPFAGSGTTALACALEGRRCITAECNPGRYEIARKRLAAPRSEEFDFDGEVGR